MKRSGRSKAEFNRIYESMDRVTFVQSLPCLGCGQTPSENAHVRNAGKGKKASSKETVPLCGVFVNRCHEKYDQYEAPYQRNSPERARIKAYAPVIEAAWRAKEPPSYLHTTDELCATCGASFREDGDQCASCAYKPCDSDC